MVFFRVLIIGIFAIYGFLRYQEYSTWGTTSAYNESMVSFAIFGVLTALSLKSVLTFTPETEEEPVKEYD